MAGPGGLTVQQAAQVGTDDGAGEFDISNAVVQVGIFEIGVYGPGRVDVGGGGGAASVGDTVVGSDGDETGHVSVYGTGSAILTKGDLMLTGPSSTALVFDGGIWGVQGATTIDDSLAAPTLSVFSGGQFRDTGGGAPNITVGNAVITGDGAIAGEVQTEDDTGGFMPGTPPGGTDPLGQMFLAGDLDLSYGGAMETQFASTADSNGYDSSALVVSGTAYLGDGGSIDDFAFYGDYLGGYGLAAGEQFPIIVADTISGYFGDYSYGDALPGSIADYLPTPPAGTHWALNIVPAWISAYGDYQINPPDGPDSALVLELDNNVGGAVERAVPRLAVGLGGGGSGASGLAAPEAVGALLAGAFGVEVQWTSTGDGATSFEVQRQTADGSWITISIVDGNVSSWLDSTARAGQVYDYRVRAIGDDGVGSNFTELASPITA